jgi:hypothetical protein
MHGGPKTEMVRFSPYSQVQVLSRMTATEVDAPGYVYDDQFELYFDIQNGDTIKNG